MTNHLSRRLLIGGSDAAIIIGADEAGLLRLCREKRGEVSGKPHPSQFCDRTNTKPPASPVRAAHAELVAALTWHSPQAIPLDADAIDLEERAEHLGTVISALSVYVAVILDDTSQNVPGGLDLRDAEAILADLVSDVTGAIQHAAEGMAGRIA